MIQDYRNAVAGAAITIATWATTEFAGVDVPGPVGAAAVTLVVFGLGFLPRPKQDPPAAE